MEDPPIKRIRLLGAGSYGVVHLAYYEGFESDQFALKSAPEGTEEALSLAKEMRVYRALQGCPGITLCYMDTTAPDPRDGLVYYSLLLEYAPVGTLHDLIQQNQGRPFPEQTVASYAHMILTGLHFMHVNGYVHCDVKPANILAFPPVHPDAPYQLRLADFGLVEEPENGHPAEFWKGRFRGTPKYMSPESVKDGVITSKLDIWSVGCIALQMLNGWEYPWPLCTTREETMDTLSHPKFDPRKLIPRWTSEGGRLFLEKCLEREPEKRWCALDLLTVQPFLVLAVCNAPISIPDSADHYSSRDICSLDL